MFGTETFSCGTIDPTLTLHLLSLFKWTNHRNLNTLRYSIIVCLLTLNLAYPASNAPMVKTQILPLSSEVTAGARVEIAILFTMEDQWHTYWKNPGDAGLSTSFEWSVPEGFTLIQRQEPVPSRHVEEGITTLIHEEEAIYVFTFLAPAVLPDTGSFQVHVDWLECNSICQTGSSSLQLAFPFPRASSPLSDLREKAMSQFPVPLTQELWRAELKKGYIELNSLVPRSKDRKLLSAQFFPYEEMVFDLGKATRIKRRFRYDSIHIYLSALETGKLQSLHGILSSRYETLEGPILINHIINQPIIP